jgi:hypothetical protein
VDDQWPSVPPGRPHFHGYIAVGMPPVANIAQTLVQANRAGIVAVEAPVEWHILGLADSQPDGAVKPDSP